MTSGSSASPDLVCLSHLRWNFVFQRPQHLMTRCARERRVYFIEEPIYGEGGTPRLEVVAGPVTVVVPRLPHGTTAADAICLQKTLLDEWMHAQGVDDFIAWYYTPMALAFTEHWTPMTIVYDCMD